jgi:hypothetical protein
MLHSTLFGVARSRAVCAIVLTCALASVGGAQQSASSTKTTAHKHHASTTKKTAASHTSPHKTSTAKSSGTHTASARTYSARKGKKTAKRPRGQQKIDSERAQAIQEALIREHYLSGDATGTWNQASEEAMRRYQGAHGWQTKEVPDSRALIKLGLGPSKDHLLNPDSAMTTVPDAPKAASLPTTSQSPAPLSSTPMRSQNSSSQPQR